MDITQYIGKPYRPGAEGPIAYDCWGLARSIAADRGFDLPRQRSQAGADLRLDLFAGREPAGLIKLDAPEPWALIVFDLKRFGLHVGTMIAEPGRFIHVAELTGTARLDRLSNPLFSKPYGQYRLENRIHRTATDSESKPVVAPGSDA